jgi:hypothetical protein
MSKTKRSAERWPTAPSPLEPGNKSSKWSDTKNIGGTDQVEHPNKQGRDAAEFGKDDGRRFVKKGGK